MMTLNVELSEFLSVAVEAIGGQCFINAYVALWVPGFSDCEYVQGFASRPEAAPMEHCWLEREGEIIDPTINRIGAGYTYFPVERFNARKRAKAIALDSEPVINSPPSVLRMSENLPFISLLGEKPDFDSELFVREVGIDFVLVAGASYMKQWQAAWRSFDGRTPEIGPREVRARWVEQALER